MKSNKTRRHFLKQASAIAVVSSAVPSKGVRDFLARTTIVESIKNKSLQPATFSAIHIQGELLTRALKNYDRLETDIYKPENDFNAGGASEGWPGDKEGRIILGLTLQAQATHREPRYLDKIISLIPEHLNEAGYLGPVLKDRIMEQQLSGHGWFLRGLCEYYKWKGDAKVKKYIQDIIYHLALPTRGHYLNYPIDPESRKQDAGGAAGTTQNTVGSWMLSSDIGCAFIFLDGVVQAYSIFPSDELKDLIEEMIGRFLQINLVAIKAQAHASLTALRGMLRYYEITGQSDLLDEVEKRYNLYRNVAMTENYENYNWFGRPEWTESCAIIDSFMLAVQLWQYTRNPLYLEDAHHIYYNAICHAQRANGGFGLDNCPGPVADSLKVYADEAWWCCTMRGGEGMASAIQYNYFPGPNELIVPFYNSSETVFMFHRKKVVLKQLSNYPFENKVAFEVQESENPSDIIFKLFKPSWTNNHELRINGHKQSFKEDDGFMTFSTALTKGTRIELKFDQQVNMYNMVNMEHSRAGHYAITYGPLLLGCQQNDLISFNQVPQVRRQSTNEWIAGNDHVRLSTVYHLMDPRVSREANYHKQILFKYS
ncbi:MAG TPA: hypothetical protein VFX43_16025 [Chitinophagaceae bacterium]|nr:hypothetical protein [Chitinophagaceae bacterium]